MTSLRKRKTDPTQKNWDKEWRLYNRYPYFKPNNRVLNVVRECFNGNVGGKKILELGAGSGSDIVSLAQDGAKGYALDFSNESIKTTEYWMKKKKVNIEAVQANIKKIPYPDNYFDLVYSVGLMEHFKNLIPLLKEQTRVIKPGGFLLIDVPQKYTLYTIAKHIRMKVNTHPFGWETEYSRGDLIKIAKKLNQDVHLIYGRDSDIVSRLPRAIRSTCNHIFSKKIEKSFLAQYVCLCIGLILKIKK